ncbi:hypothetical protein IBX73_05640 [candidate division WOR-3 bacterium]|nr:hypothetical protein [candidate division WOR-3 bacterium]
MKMKRTALSLLIICIISLVYCGRKEAEIDAVTQQLLQVQDTLPLQITHLSPVGKTESIGETFKILVGFNQPMVPLARIGTDDRQGPLEIEPGLKGRYQWLGTRTLAFIPDDTLVPATKFNVRLDRNKIRSLTGMSLARDTAWSFESVRPRLMASAPHHGAQFIERAANIYLYFNVEMSPNRVCDRIKIYYTKGVPSKVWCAETQTGKPRFRGEAKFQVRNLRDEEKKEYPLSDWDNGRTLVLVPRESLPLEAQIEVALHAGLLARAGNLGTEDEGMLKYNTYNEFTLLEYNRDAPAEDPLRLCFSNPTLINELVNNMKIEPAVEIPAEYQEQAWSSNEAYLFLPFLAGVEYEIIISRDLKDIYGNRLDQDHRFKFKKGDYTPHVEIPTGINIVEAQSDLRFPITVVNADSVHLRMARLSIDEAVPFLKSPDIFWSRKEFAPPRPGFFATDRRWHIGARQIHRNEQMRVPIELKEILGAGRTGLVFIEVDNLGQTRYNGDPRYSRAFVEISNIGITWKYSPENNLVWVTSLNDARSVKGARVQIRDDSNRILWQGLTDAYGFCESPGWADPGFGLARHPGRQDAQYDYEWQGYDEPRLWLTVLSAEDAAVYSNRWSFGIDPWRFNISYAWWVQPEEYGAYIFTEKGLYRSGETVHVKGTIRKKNRGQWILPDVDRVLFTLRNSRDEEVMADTLRVNQQGSFFRNITLDTEAVTGIYSLRVTMPGKTAAFYETFRVEAFRPAEFEVKVTAPQDTFLASTSFKGTIQSNYLFGMPMKNVPVAWNLRRSDHRLDFPAYKGYEFGEYIEGHERGLLASGTGKANEQGEFRVAVRLSKSDIPAPSLIYLEGIVTAPNMTTVSGEQNWLALNAEYMIGLKTLKHLFVAGDTCDLNVICVDLAGGTISRRNITVELFKQEWKSIKKARLGGRYEWISEPVETKVATYRIKSSRDPITIRMAPDSPGYYFARASGKDNAGRMSVTRKYFYVTGPGSAGWQMRDDDIIELVADQDDYQVGDTARIMVKSPYDSARCLVTVERELVIDRFTRTIRGNADFIELPVRSDFAPNVYVCVTLLRGRVRDLSWSEEKEQDVGKPQFKIGYLNLRVSAAEKKLRILARPDKATYEPRDTVVLALEVKDHAGRSVANSEVALFVVDVGVLNLINFQTPDPFNYFYSSRSLSVRTIESRVNILGERQYGEKGKERGGGGMYDAEGVSYREKFIATAFYKADVMTDQQGRSTVRFALPDNLTKFRIMAVAQARNSQFGSAESTLVVTKPFLMTPSIPRFCRVGDEFRAGVVLHNRTTTKEKASVQCAAIGLTQLGPSEKEVVLMPGASAELLFRFNAEEIGEATFTFTGQLGNEKDAVCLKIPVISVPLYEAAATFSSTEDSALQAIIVPSQIHERMGGLEIRLAPTFVVGMNQSLDFLWNYRYYCLEQLLSKILPLIAGEKMINDFKLAPVSGRALRDTVQAVLDQVALFQSADGGFVYFKGSRYPCPYLSAYTLYVLHRAQAAGYSIDRKAAARVVDFLSRVLRWEDADWTYPYDEDARLTARAFCLYSLALWSRNEHAYATRLFERREQLGIFAKTLLLKSGRILDMGSVFENEITRSLINKVKVSASSAHFEEIRDHGWTFPSTAKITAAVAQTFIELNIPFTYLEQTMHWLVQERNAKNPTTHDNAFVFDAFLAYYNRFEREEPSFVATVLLNGEEIVREIFKGRTGERPVAHNITFDRIAKDTLLPVRITKQGPGRLYYTLRMNYALSERPYPIDAGFYVRNEILSLEGKPVRKYKRGEVYKVVVRVVTPETRLFAVVEDQLPAGFVPVQTYFATETRQVSERFEESRWEEKKHWWGTFDHTEYYDDRVLLFAQQLLPGEHTETYFIRAACAGKFLVPAAQAMEMYAPEVFGTSAQRYLVIE